MTRPKRVTEKQLAANRRNARKSTGPRTPEGKARSRWNALKHGVLARAVIPMPLEDYESRADFDALLSALCDEVQPASPLEEIFVERIAVSYWRLGRVLRAEAGAIARRQDRPDTSSVPYPLIALAAFGLPPQPTPPPSPTSRLNALEAALTNKGRLRSLMLDENPDLRDATDEQVLDAAKALRAELADEAARHRERSHALRQAERAIPHLKDATQLSRYEATIERQLYRALDALERLKRLRGGERVPPPLRLAVDGPPEDLE